MKVSLRFPESNNATKTSGTPLVRLKLPTQILGLPTVSSVSAGDTSAARSSMSLRFDLTTAFRSFPSLRLSYRPSDGQIPFAVVVKSGIGNFGSPVESPVKMTAEFGLSVDRNPSFLIKFSPQFGDFCVKKVVRQEDFGKDEFFVESWKPSAVIDRVLSGTEVTARSVVPVSKVADVKVRWGVRVPSATGSVNLPHLVINKLSIEFDSRRKEVTPEENDHQLEELRNEFSRKKVSLAAVFAGKFWGKK